MNGKRSDVLILGGGVIGLACAHYLLKAGRTVTLLEQNAAGGGASHGSCGTITPSHAPPLAMPGMMPKALKWMLQTNAPFYIRPRLDFTLFNWLLRFSAHCNWGDFHRISAIKAGLLKQSRERLVELIEDNRLDCEFEVKGTLGVFRDMRAFDLSAWLPKTLYECGLEIETLGGEQARAKEPALNDSVVAGYFIPGDAHLRPERYTAELLRSVKALGGEICESTKIVGFDVSAQTVKAVITERGLFSGTDVILALGAWSPTLAKSLELKMPIQPGKGYSITYDRPVPCPSIPLVLKERGVCVTSWRSGYRLGSTMEFSGYDASLNRRRLEALKLAAAEYLHAPIGKKVQEEWCGWRPMTYDDMPIIGRAPNLKNLLLATGHGMLGVTLSPITGTLISEIVTGKSLSFDISPFSPSRF